LIADLLNWKKLRLALWYLLFCLLVLFLQNTLLGGLTLFGVKMLFVPAACVAVGILEGGFRGGLFGLLAGFLCDMAFPENSVLFTILFPVLGFCAGAAAEFWLSRTFSAYLAAAAVGMAITGLCQMVHVLLREPGAILYCLLMVLAQTLWSLPMAAVVYFPARAISRTQRPV